MNSAGLLNKLNQACWLGFAILLPFGPIWSTWLILPLVILGIGIRIQSKQTISNQSSFPFPGLMIVFWLLTLASVLYSSNQTEALTKTIQKAAFLLFPILYFLNPSGILVHSKFRTYYIFSVCLSLLSCYLASFYEYLSLGDHHFYYSSFVRWMHPSYFSLHLLLASSILLYDLKTISLKTIPTKNQLFSFFIFLFIQIGLANTASKAGIIIDGILLIFFSYIVLKNARYGQFRFIILLVLAGFSLFFLSKTSLLEKTRFKSLLTYVKSGGEKADAGDSNRMRTQIYQASIEVAKENWLFGVGCGDVMDELENYYQRLNLRIPAERTYNPHNQFLQTTISNGILGLILLLTMFMGGFWAGIKYQSPVFLSFLFICFVHFMFESMLERQNGIYFFCFIYLLLLPSKSSTVSS
ncbi:MAG: O-antigen ligase family protein [Bacteroidia bacterium]|nr:O-antigen ligase family protein [Bacteroidia bacterium]